MKPRKFYVAVPTDDRVFFHILRGYLIGGLSLLILLIVLDWLIR